jgi:hypothetical protein
MITDNGLQIPDGGGFETLKRLSAINLIQRTMLNLKTEPAFLPNAS